MEMFRVWLCVMETLNSKDATSNLKIKWKETCFKAEMLQK